MARNVDQLELVALHRKGCDDPAKRERRTFDFVVNGASLFEATGASLSDMCGCISDPRFEPELAGRMNVKSVTMLTSDLRMGVGNRAVLFECPECGDFACGAITVFVSRDGNSVRWSDFAYENGFEPQTPRTGLGPFAFDWAAYLAAFSGAHAW
ncbi:hypothetical protein BwSF12_33100 [Bradyrhizobium ottawaense]|nr:hypothetical protein TM102_26130 [Bradyrhizobium sp. TM102]GMO33698.1 hypothetical protein BwSF12_33100 [Bradyrhizobium ottawaense]GMO90717.1 hypothetical protein BwSF19_65190 [Bradyrhizobium ottawaense]